jgi:transposase InsO family protein
LYTDFTELLFDRQRQKAHLMPLVDHASKYVVGWSVATAKNTAMALAAWSRARRNLEHFGIDLATVIVHHDQDTVHTAHEWLRHVRLLDKARCPTRSTAPGTTRRWSRSTATSMPRTVPGSGTSAISPA